MNKKIFENILESNKIYTYDNVELTILNPNYKKSIFTRIPKILTFTGVLCYHKGDNLVLLSIEDNNKTKDLYFDFKQICGIKRNN